MLDQLVHIINSSNTEIVGESIFIQSHNVRDLNCLNLLNTRNCIKSFNRNGDIVVFEDLRVGDSVNIELSLYELTEMGYYENLDRFVKKNQYTIPTHQFYVRDINCFSTECGAIINAYTAVISLIDTIKENAKHCYSEAGDDFSIIFREDKALLLPFVYSATDIHNISENNISNINKVSEILKNSDSKEKMIFVNELIDFLSTKDDNDKFGFLLSNIDSFFERANNAYQYYIRDFSYNKLQAELDNEALEYSKKIQSVINDAQTKLIAIPTAFVLAVANIDFENILDNKNIGIVLSLFVFVVLIDLFIRNQKSALTFISQNIDRYKKSFKTTNKVVQESFETVDKEWKKQNRRVAIIRCITWSVPIILLIVLIIFLLTQKPINIDTTAQ
ncbi:MAG: hypothetical protein LBH22_02725 [Bacteroidales bacterium]|jgi:hypothetical protein|nr:hypothetical protein [Bacteroidales bacterium]